MERTNVLVIGGSAAGIVASVTGKSCHPDKDFLLIRKEKQVITPCGIPYIFGSLESSNKDLVPDAVLSEAGIKLKIGEVVSIDQKNNVCKIADGTDINFEKLVLATGSTPVIPEWLKGTELKNVFTIPKNKEYIDEILVKLKDCKKVVIIGGGFIGVEISDEINKTNKDVTIVEILPHILALVFDEEITVKAEEIIKSSGVKIKTGVGVKEILGDKKVSGVLLNNGEKLEADAVILSVGYRPNISLAEKSGIKINEIGFIKVDEYMRTDNPDIFAVGDCAGKRDFLSRKLSGVMLASTACAEARIAAMNLYKLSSVKAFSGTIAVFSTALGEIGFGAAGLTENQAVKEGFDIVSGTFEGIDKHPGTLLGTHKQMVKLIVARESGTILGGEVIGGPSTGELLNLIGVVIQNRMTVDSILTAQIGTHPLLTAPPTAYPLIKAAEVVAKKIKATC
ncbi:MAG: FAD-dependent oxidoreductase [Acidobacteriota bacterium]|nr:FAD-dependent oxidoreductase [Acidobacteriota bacterium]